MVFGAAVLALCAGQSRTARAESPDPLVKMFVWWNAAYKQKDGFTAELSRDIHRRRRHAHQRQGSLRRGRDLAKHFRDIQARTEMVAIELPFLDEFTSPTAIASLLITSSGPVSTARTAANASWVS